MQINEVDITADAVLLFLGSEVPSVLSRKILLTVRSWMLRNQYTACVKRSVVRSDDSRGTSTPACAWHRPGIYLPVGYVSVKAIEAVSKSDSQLADQLLRAPACEPARATLPASQHEHQPASHAEMQPGIRASVCFAPA